MTNVSKMEHIVKQQKTAFCAQRFRGPKKNPFEYSLVNELGE